MKEQIITQEHDFGKLCVREDGILQLHSEQDRFLIEDYKALCAAIGSISNNNLMPYMVDERGRQRYMDKESKKYISQNIHKYVSAFAIIEDSQVLRFMMNTFVKMYRPRIPVKMFKSEKEACAWLLTYVVTQ